MGTEIGILGGYGFQGQVTAGDGSDKQGKMGAGYNNLNREKKKQQLTFKMESLNAHCLDHQAANMTPPSTHCDLPDGMLQTVRAPDKSPRIGA